MFCSTLLAFGIGGFRTPAAFKIQLFVTKVNVWNLIALLHLVIVEGPRSTSEEHRRIKIEAISSFPSVWVSLIEFYSIMLSLMII